MTWMRACFKSTLCIDAYRSWYIYTKLDERSSAMFTMYGIQCASIPMKSEHNVKPYELLRIAASCEK